MCRADIAPGARGLLGELLGTMARSLADESGVPAADVIIGPVDFGDAEQDGPS